jgi:hypothetical protein
MPGPVLIEREPLLADLRGDPEFIEIVRRLEWRAAEQRRRLGVDEPDAGRSTPAAAAHWAGREPLLAAH